MRKKFEPIDSIEVKASKPHPENTTYKVSIGMEDWTEIIVKVIKVQMVYGGKISGRKSPSYPLGSDDYHKVALSIEKLILRNKSDEDTVIVV